MTRFPKKTDTGKPFLTGNVIKGEKGDSPFIGIPSTPIIIVRKDFVSGEYNYDSSYANLSVHKDGAVQGGWTVSTAVVNPDVTYTIENNVITITGITADDGIIALKATKSTATVFFSVHWITVLEGAGGADGDPGEKGDTGTDGAKGDEGNPGDGLVIKKFVIKMRGVISAETTTDGAILHTTLADHELTVGHKIFYKATSTGGQDVLCTVTAVIDEYNFRTDYTYDGDESADITDLRNLRSVNNSTAQSIYLPEILPVGVRPVDMQLIRIDSGAYEMYSSCGTALFSAPAYNTFWSSLMMKSGGGSDATLNFDLSVRYAKILDYKFNLYLRMTTYPGKTWSADYSGLVFELYVAYRNYSGTPKESSEAGVWGDISGVLANQTDLMSALDAKTDKTDFEALETIVGELESGVVVDGTPEAGQMAEWVTDSTIKGNPNITWDGFTFIVDGDIAATGDIAAHYEPPLL